MISQTQQMVYRLSNLDTQYEKNSYQMSTKKELQYGSDDSVLYARIVSVDDKIRTYEGLQSQIERTTLQNDTSDSSLSEIKKILEFAKQELIKANTATTTPEGLAAIASSISGIKENIYQLANTQVEGEYIFAGSDSSIKPFEKNATGKVTYQGNNQLRQVAVEEGSYREKGVTGFDMMFYSTDIATKNDSTLTFTESQRIFDQDRNEWKMTTANAGVDLKFPATTTSTSPLSTKLIDGNNKIWTLNTATSTLEDTIGNTMPVTPPTPPETLYKLKGSDNTSGMGINELVKYDSTGSIVTPIQVLVPKVGTTGREIDIPKIDGTKFEAKTNIFDFIDSTVNALKKVDSFGNPITDAQSKSLISNSLGEIDKAFDAVNIAHADLGGKNRVFEISLERINSKLTQYNVLSEEISGADLTKVAMEAKALELTYTALYSTISKTNQLSLVNFLN